MAEGKPLAYLYSQKALLAGRVEMLILEPESLTVRRNENLQQLRTDVRGPIRQQAGVSSACPQAQLQGKQGIHSNDNFLEPSSYSSSGLSYHTFAVGERQQ